MVRIEIVADGCPSPRTRDEADQEPAAAVAELPLLLLRHSRSPGARSARGAQSLPSVNTAPVPRL